VCAFFWGGGKHLFPVILSALRQSLQLGLQGQGPIGMQRGLFVAAADEDAESRRSSR
jgi:hypothetical protein